MDDFSKGFPKSIVVAIIASALSVVVLFSWTIPALKNLRYQAQVAKQAEYDYTAGADYISQVVTTYEALSSGSIGDLLNIAAPVDIDIPAALVQLDAMVSQSGLSLNALSPSSENGSAATISVVVSGDYGQLQEFLKLIEKNLRPFNISSITISSYSSGTDTTTIGTCSIVLTKIATSSDKE